LKACKVDIHAPKVPIIKEVIWSSSIQNWLKFNTANVNSPNMAAASGIFRNANGEYTACFAQYLGHVNALLVELTATIDSH